MNLRNKFSKHFKCCVPAGCGSWPADALFGSVEVESVPGTAGTAPIEATFDNDDNAFQ